MSECRPHELMNFPEGQAFTIAHLSDLHATDVRLGSPRDVLGKRALGWLSWRHRRRHEHQASVLRALIADLHQRAPDHIAITGDLTHLGLPSEIAAATNWLERIGPAEQVSVVPGNHDAYAGAEGAERWLPWRHYMGDLAGPPADADDADADARGFPWIRRIGGHIALIGISSARPTAPLLATGRVGARQRARVEALLATLAAEGRVRIVLLHHPPVAAGQSRRRQLDDAAEVRALLTRAGAELLLHGHTHECHEGVVRGPHGPIPVLGVASSSSAGPRPARRARYRLVRIVPERATDGTPRCRISWQLRGFDAATGGFVAETEEPALAHSAG
ncbi:metallophosphoesterase [Myxococcota bacterium]|nr:metallophosphoesterase [Myxococcota bacterium]MCZ7620064.1 metallophosphoesterase [Myxococcota bacterium]